MPAKNKRLASASRALTRARDGKPVSEQRTSQAAAQLARARAKKLGKRRCSQISASGGRAGKGVSRSGRPRKAATTARSK